MRKYYFISTEHLKNKLWFRDNEDFKVGMNKVALLAGHTNVQIVCFVLMSNHVHFLLSADSWEDANRFITEFKNHYARYIYHKYGVWELLRRNDVDIQEVENSEEALERVIAYIQMNCVAANICGHPAQYRWGTGMCFFSDTERKGVCLNTLFRNKIQKLVHSNLDVSGYLLLGDDGYILPESYIDVKAVEALFKTAKRYDYFLRMSSKAKTRMEANEAPGFKDQVVLSAIGDLCYTLFRKPNAQALTYTELTELMKQLRFRFSSNIEQLCRVTGLEYEKIAKMLDSI